MDSAVCRNCRTDSGELAQPKLMLGYVIQVLVASGTPKLKFVCRVPYRGSVSAGPKLAQVLLTMRS